MDEYIERDSAAAFAYNCGAVYVSNRLSNKNAFQSADVAPVRHGRLENITGGMITLGDCSECKVRQPVIGTNYCKNCGAKMDGGHDG